MPTLAQVRQQFPQYSDMSDTDLAAALHQKFYSDMPADVFNAKIAHTPASPDSIAGPGVGGQALSAVSGAADAASFGQAPSYLGGGLGTSAVGRDIGRKLGGYFGAPDLGGNIGMGIGGALGINPLTSTTAALAAKAYDPDSFNKIAQPATKGLEDFNTAAAQQHPIAHGAGEIGGAIASFPAGVTDAAITGIRGTATAVRDIGWLGRAGRNAGDAGLWGAGYGAGSANVDPNAPMADQLVQRGENAVKTAIPSAIAGGVMSPVVDAGLGIAGTLADRARKAYNPSGAAAARQAQKMDADYGDLFNPATGKITPPPSPTAGHPLVLDMENAPIAANDPRAMNLDLYGPNGIKALKQALRVPNNPMAKQFWAALKGRQALQPDDIVKGFANTYGDPANFESDIAKQVDLRRKMTGPMFDDAWTLPPASTREGADKLATMLNTPIGKRIMEGADEEAANRPFDTSWSDMKKLHYAKMTLDGLISGAKKGQVDVIPSTGGQKAWQLGTLQNWKRTVFGDPANGYEGGIVDNQPYKDAMGLFAGDAAMTGAAKEGAEDALGMTPYQLQEKLAKLSPGEADLYRRGIGYAAVTDKIIPGNYMRDRVSGKLMDLDLLAKLKMAAPDDATWQKFKQLVEVKGNQAAKFRSLGGSDTMSNAAEDEEAAQPIENLKKGAETIAAVATHGPVGALLSLGGRGVRKLTGMTPKYAGEFTKAAMGNMPDAAAQSARYFNDVARAQQKLDLVRRAFTSGAGPIGAAIGNPPQNENGGQ